MCMPTPSLAPVRTGIPALDSCFSGDAHSRLHFGDVVHVRGASGSGKTRLLYSLTATCCMPRDYLSCQLGGWNKAAFVFDMDATLDVGRFQDILVGRLRKFLPAVPFATLVDECLKRLHIFRPTSTEQLGVTLAHLPVYHSKNFPHADVGMVAIHSFDAFHWVNHFRAEQQQTSPSLSKNVAYHNVITELETLRHSFGAIIFITHWGLFGSNKSVASMFEMARSSVVNPISHLSGTSRTFHLYLPGDSTTGPETYDHDSQLISVVRNP
jgi:DNA-repair protein XRCC2